MVPCGIASAVPLHLVDRKASLQIERPARRGSPATPTGGGDRQPITVSLYSPADPTFRDPVFRGEVGPATAPVKIPAGDFVASLLQGHNAPDLQRLHAAPAARVRLAYQARDGWSLIARCRTALSGRVVGGATVRVAETGGFGKDPAPFGTATTDADGLALFSGIHASLASVAAQHPDFLSAAAQGLVAGPGTFTVRDLDLQTGGRVRATVSLHGRPVAGAKCQVAALAALPLNRNDPYREVWEGPVDAKGVCRSTPLAAGRYKLRVHVPESSSQVMRWVSVDEARDTDEDVALAPSRISGEVRRGQDPAEGYAVHARPLGDQPAGIVIEDVGSATSDADGRYELTLWTPGRYSLYLKSPSGTSTPIRQQVTVDGDDEQVDFHVDGNPIRGTVVDEAGAPLAGATAALTWARGSVKTETDAQGQFQLDYQSPLDGASLLAQKEGYRRTQVDVRVGDGQGIAPVTLVLKRSGASRGTVVSADGTPVAGAMVASLTAPPIGTGLFAMTRTDANGTFEVSAPPGPLQVFVSGPGCPLSFFALQIPADSSAAGDGPGTGPTVVCQGTPASLEMTLVDDQGKPLTQTGVILRQNGEIVPRPVLEAHLAQLGLPALSDGEGRLVIAGIAAGDYDLFLNLRASESSIAAGIREGFLTSLTVPALTNTELQLTFRPGP
jgi:hypothetical protein